MIRTCRHVYPKSEKIMGGIHPYFEILYVLSGELCLQWMGESYSFHPHSLAIIYPDTPHQVAALSENCSFWFIELEMKDPGLFPSLDTCITWNRQQAAAAPVTIEEPAYGVTLSLLTATILSGKIETSDYYKVLAVLDIHKLLIMIKAAGNRETPALSEPSTAHESVIFLMRYMETEYAKPISLKTMAELTHFNPSYLIRIFKKINGITPAQYLQSLRLNAAACYLSTTGLSVEEIALCCGFQSIHYFSQSFKKKLGESPSLWRKRLRRNV
ncbi:AraC family transcriptional regulator [Paenibacillus sp. NPDC056579]|uniref:AraC family transcriptional regulator n=1 Tax=Paenibacillus sp. NPDC056579 TaxID=3345871 RepID=UPI0036BBB270